MEPSFSEINGYILPNISKTRGLSVERCMKHNPKETQTVFRASTVSTSVTGVSTAADIAKVSASTFTPTGVESEETLSEHSLPCYVVPVLYRPEKTSSPTHMKTVGRNLQMPFSKSFQLELEKKLEERKTLQELSFPYTRKFEKGKITNDFVVYPLSEGSRMVKKPDLEHRQVKSVQTGTPTDTHASDYITDISHETGRRSILPFKKYVQAIENNLCIHKKPSSIKTGDDTDIDLQDEEIEDVQNTIDYYSCIGNSRSSILRDITDILSPSEQSIYRRTSDLGEIIEKRNRLLSLHTLQECGRSDGQVQVGIAVSTTETMTESTQRSASMQTASSCILEQASNESMEKITQTAMKNIERILVMLPREKAVRIVTPGSMAREMGDEGIDDRAKKSAMKMPDKPRYTKTVRIDPKFFQNPSLR